jgi:Mycoplasma protein of unknown function, DUF285
LDFALTTGFCFFARSFLLSALSAAPSRHRNADNPLLQLFSTLPAAILRRIYQFAVRVIYTHDELIKAVDEYHAVPPPLPRSGRRRRRGTGCLPPPWYRHMSEWDVSGVVDFSSVFSQYRNDGLRLVRFGDLSGWDVSNGTDFCNMFQGCRNFRGGTVLSRWNVAKGTNFHGMFGDCVVFQGDAFPVGMYRKEYISA